MKIEITQSAASESVHVARQLQQETFTSSPDLNSPEKWSNVRSIDGWSAFDCNKVCAAQKAWMKQLFEQIKRKRFFHWISDDFQYCISKSRLMRQDRVRRRFRRFQSDGWKKSEKLGLAGKVRKEGRGEKQCRAQLKHGIWQQIGNFSVVIELRESFKVK